MNIPKRKQGGFTIIELLIATSVFSVVLLIFLASFVKISNMFYKGVNISNTQEASRTLIDDIGNDIRFTNSPPTIIPANASGMGYFCVGQHRYKYDLGSQVGNLTTPYGITREDVSGATCPDPATTPGTNPVELLDFQMQLNKMVFSCDDNKTCSISILVVYYGSDNTVLVSSNPAYSSTQWKAPDASCSGGLSSSQICATASYSTSVSQKI